MRCVYVHVCVWEEEMVGGTAVGGRVGGWWEEIVGGWWEGRVRGTVVEGVSNRGQYMHKRMYTYTCNRHTHTHTHQTHALTHTNTRMYLHSHTYKPHTYNHAYANRTPTMHTQKQKQSSLLPHKVTLPSEARMPVH